MKELLVIAMLLFPSGLWAQFGQSNNVQIIGGKCQLMDYQNKLKADFSVDARRTLFQKNWAAVMGLKFGVEYRRVHRLGIGVYFLNTRVFDEVFEPDLPGIDELEYEFNYSTIYYDRVLFFNRNWAFETRVNVAGLSTRIEEEVINNDEENRQRIEQTNIDLRLNLLELNLGVAFYF